MRENLYRKETTKSSLFILSIHIPCMSCRTFWMTLDDVDHILLLKGFMGHSYHFKSSDAWSDETFRKCFCYSYQMPKRVIKVKVRERETWWSDPLIISSQILILIITTLIIISCLLMVEKRRIFSFKWFLLSENFPSEIWNKISTENSMWYSTKLIHSLLMGCCFRIPQNLSFSWAPRKLKKRESISNNKPVKLMSSLVMLIKCCYVTQRFSSDWIIQMIPWCGLMIITLSLNLKSLFFSSGWLYLRLGRHSSWMGHNRFWEVASNFLIVLTGVNNWIGMRKQFMVTDSDFDHPIESSTGPSWMFASSQK